jgi:hypothetical protein
MVGHVAVSVLNQRQRPFLGRGLDTRLFEHNAAPQQRRDLRNVAGKIVLMWNKRRRPAPFNASPMTTFLAWRVAFKTTWLCAYCWTRGTTCRSRARRACRGGVRSQI